MTPEQIQKQALVWQEELRKQKETRIQAQAVVDQATLAIRNLEGGLKFAEMLLSSEQLEIDPVSEEVVEPSSKKK